MKRIKVPKGETYGELTVIHESTSTPRRKFWCVCSCGNKTEVRLDHLRSGHTSSCGSCGIEYDGKRMTVKEWAEKYKINESTLRARLVTMGLKEALALGNNR